VTRGRRRRRDETNAARRIESRRKPTERQSRGGAKRPWWTRLARRLIDPGVSKNPKSTIDRSPFASNAQSRRFGIRETRLRQRGRNTRGRVILGARAEPTLACPDASAVLLVWRAVSCFCRRNQKQRGHLVARLTVAFLDFSSSATTRERALPHARRAPATLSPHAPAPSRARTPLADRSERRSRLDRASPRSVTTAFRDRHPRRDVRGKRRASARAEPRVFWRAFDAPARRESAARETSSEAGAPSLARAPRPA
jgi:hypothetical protein